MAPMVVTPAHVLAAAAAADQRSFRITFAATFLTILTVALISQVLMLRWRPWFPGAESTRSLTGGVRAATRSIMSHLI